MIQTSKLPSNLLNSQETMVYNAIHCPKISELPNDESLVVVITMWRNYLGIREQMTMEEISMNIQHIKNNYSDFTLEMINLAIKYSLTGELNVEVKPYGAFSPLYISSILNEYRQYTIQIKVKVNEKLKREKEKEQLNIQYTEEQKIKNRLMYLEYYRDMVSKEILRDFKNIMWNFLSSNNLAQNIVADADFVKKETVKKRNQFIDLSIDDVTELEQYSIMKQFFEKNPSFDFTTYQLI